MKRIRIGRPSPAMVVASVALFVAMGGTGVAAVDYARDAGAVDGKSAVHSGASRSNAAGKLVATDRRGSDKGTLPSKFLDDVPVTQTFGRAFDVVDNTPGAPAGIGRATSIGPLAAACNDEAGPAGVENPVTTVSLTNTSGETVNVAAQRSSANPDTSDAPRVLGLPSGGVATITLSNSGTFTFHAERRGVNTIVNGVIRQDGRGGPTATCLVYGTVMRIED